MGHVLCHIQAGSTGLKKKKSKSRKWLSSFADSYVLTELWFIVSGLVYSGVEL